MKRKDILDTAKGYVTKDRASQHGDMENNFNTIAMYWSGQAREKGGKYPAFFMRFECFLSRAKLRTTQIGQDQNLRNQA